MKKQLLSLIIGLLLLGSLTACEGTSPPPGGPGDLCGNGKHDEGEKCDIAIKDKSDPHFCPTEKSCSDEGLTLQGDKCQARCEDLCGNGKKDKGEICEKEEGVSDLPKCKGETECTRQTSSEPGVKAWKYSRTQPDNFCTSQCKEVVLECSPQRDGHCPSKCNETEGDPLYDLDCGPFWKTCESDLDCPLIAPKCSPLRSVDAVGPDKEDAPVKFCSRDCSSESPTPDSALCSGLYNPKAPTLPALCDSDNTQVAAEGLGSRARMCYPTCEKDADCDPSNQIVCKYFPSNNTRFCVYDPVHPVGHLGQPCKSEPNQGESSGCAENEVCVKGDFGSTSTDYDGICTIKCKLSDPKGTRCPDDFECQSNTLVTQEITENGVKKIVGGAYACFKKCSAATPCGLNAGYCSNIKDGFSEGTCTQLPDTCTTDKSCRKEKGDTTSVCVDHKLQDFPNRKVCVKGVGASTGGKKVGQPATNVSECEGGPNAIVNNWNSKQVCSFDCSANGAECPDGSACVSLTKDNSFCRPKCGTGLPDCATGTCRGMPLFTEPPQYKVCL